MALIPQGGAGCHHWTAVTQCFPTQTVCNVPRAPQVQNKSLISLKSANTEITALALYIDLWALEMDAKLKCRKEEMPDKNNG